MAGLDKRFDKRYYPQYGPEALVGSSKRGSEKDAKARRHLATMEVVFAVWALGFARRINLWTLKDVGGRLVWEWHVR